MWANNGRSAVTWTHFVLPRQQHKSHSHMHRSAGSEPVPLHDSEDLQKKMDWFLWNLNCSHFAALCWLKVMLMSLQRTLNHCLYIPVTTTTPKKKSPTPCHPSRWTNTWLWGPSLTRGYPATRYAKSLWIPDTSARAGLRGDFLSDNCWISLTLYIDSGPMGWSLARSRAYLVKWGLIDSFELYILVYILSKPMLLVSSMTCSDHPWVEGFKEFFLKVMSEDLRENQTWFILSTLAWLKHCPWAMGGT